MNTDYIIILIFSYIVGSIPFGLIVTKIFLKKDIRNLGSGNIGATNVLRTGKKSLAILTLLLDVFKGFIVIFFVSKYYENLIHLSGLICFLGHIFPCWLKFRGGKGIATYLGITLALSLKLFLIFSFIWLIVLLLTKYSSVSSIISALFISLYVFFNFNNYEIYMFFSMFVIIVFTHKDNIIRLKNKTENKIKFK